MAPDRQYAVASLLFDYVKSPSLRHLRDPHSVHKLARDIVNALDRASSVWKKWEPDREEIAKAAAPCWIPTEDLQSFLNTLPGPPLTKTDVEQRLRAIWEEPHTTYPKDELKEGCLAVYLAEKSQGTGMRAIIGALQEHIEREEERLRNEQQEQYRHWKEDERVKLEQRFLSGADCGWTRIEKSEALYCRRNGRAFRIIQGKDKRWTLYRIKELADKGDLLGTYQGRGDANKALQQIAYAPEPHR
ncbi:hypothetical protein NLM33_32575 [Bradyrhizobium sp. CCGUVB1N3]|uniref:hypothetical protein n=1 Tax=Bradyrhizobium sp. CCGUVB1N3 TaxID=2949629 RepID=UPI0020B32450|nr:hypothetical protein [Bradyrhizobium sp. CCGUVB1N3]MCP3475059.1 hypothetical protein [Bradyrhizobium sp. CCGUVB1N3]